MRMKKVLAGTLATAMVASLVGCGGSTTETATEAAKDSGAADASEEVEVNY